MLNYDIRINRQEKPPMVTDSLKRL